MGATMRKYNPNPKHESAGAGGRRGTRLDLSPAQAQQLLNDPANSYAVPGKTQVLGVSGGTIYCFQDDGAGGFHAYPISGQEASQKFPTAGRWLCSKLNTNAKRLSRMS